MHPNMYIIPQMGIGGGGLAKTFPFAVNAVQRSTGKVWPPTEHDSPTLCYVPLEIRTTRSPVSSVISGIPAFKSIVA